VSWTGISAPTATDWIELVSTGAADTSYVAWVYTNGASAGSRTLTVPSSTLPGSYEARLFAQDSLQRIAVSNTISVQPPGLVASPTTVAAGGMLTVTWTNVGAPTPTDWVELVPTGATDANWAAWIYTTGHATDSTTFSVPSSLSAGTYEVRLFSGTTAQRLSVSNAIAVTASGTSVMASPVKAAPGGSLTVSWKNIAAPTAADWVGLYTVGSADANFVVRSNANGRASDRMLMTLPGSLVAGAYELRLFSNNTFTLLATGNGIDVEAGPGLSVSSLTVPAGSTLNVAWAGIAAPTATDWIALAPINNSDTTWVAWRYITGAASGNVGLAIPASVPMGTYEVRLFLNDGTQRVAVSNHVKVGPTVVVSPTTVAPGATVAVTWAGITTPTATDWFAFVPLNALDANWLAWFYTTGRSADTMTFTIPPNLPAGVYDLRLFANDSGTRIGLSNIVTVTAPGPSLATTPTSVGAGATITATWQGIAAPSVNNWVGVYAGGSPDPSFLTQVFTNGQSSGSTPIILGALAPGSYELRLFSSGFTRLAVSNTFTVIAGAAVHASPSTVSKGGTVTVTWEGVGTPTPTDWFALAPVGADDTSYVSWVYSMGGATGATTLTVPASAASGDYEVRFFAHDQPLRIAVSNLVVVVP